jgi:flagellar biosynthesis protein FliR
MLTSFWARQTSEKPKSEIVKTKAAKRFLNLSVLCIVFSPECKYTVLNMIAKSMQKSKSKSHYFQQKKYLFFVSA